MEVFPLLFYILEGMLADTSGMYNADQLKQRTIGHARAWFPSRRSVANQRGLFVRRLEGHVLSGRSGGMKASYLSEGLRSLCKVSCVNQWHCSKVKWQPLYIHRHDDQQSRSVLCLLTFSVLRAHRLHFKAYGYLFSPRLEISQWIPDLAIALYFWRDQFVFSASVSAEIGQGRTVCDSIHILPLFASSSNTHGCSDIRSHEPMPFAPTFSLQVCIPLHI